MKKWNIIITALLIYTFWSCEKVIDIDLASVKPQIVIDGTITDQPGPYTVKIKKSGDYFNQGAFPAVTDASVTISDNAGNSETLTEVDNGIYQTTVMQGVPGRTYTLKVIAEGEEYSGTSTMQEAIEIDSLTYEYISGGFGPIEEGYKIYCHYTATEVNETYCRFKVYCNGDLLEEYYLSSGMFNMGIQNEDNPFEENDTIKVELHNLDKVTYMYYSNLKDILGQAGGMMTGTPANPNTNLNNGALGYFGAFTVRADSIVIK